MSSSQTASRSLRDDEVDVSLCFVEDCGDRGQLESYRRWLAPQERAHGERFAFEKDRLLHTIAWALVRTSLSSVAAVEPSRWRFAPTAQGRPEPVSPSPAAAALRCNVSHAAGLVACVVARSHDVGIDVESDRRSLPAVDLARRFFAAAEEAELAAIDTRLRQARFLALWTLKEAYLKARGCGLSQPLDSLRATVADDGSLTVDLARDTELDIDAWSFLAFRFGARYAGAVAIRSGRLTPIRARLVRRTPDSNGSLLAEVSLRPAPHVSAIDLSLVADPDGRSR